MILIVDRREAEINLRPAASAVQSGQRRHNHARNIRRVVQGLPDFSSLAFAEAQHAPWSFLCRDQRQVLRELRVGAAGRVREGDMHLVHAVLETLQVIAGNALHIPRIDDARRFTVRKGRKSGRSAVPEIGPDHSKIFFAGVDADLNLAGKSGCLGRLFDALA